MKELPIIRKANRPAKRNVPHWASSQDTIEKYLLKSMSRLVRIAYLYWCLGWTAKEVGDELGEPVTTVKSVLEKLRRI